MFPIDTFNVIHLALLVSIQEYPNNNNLWYLSTMTAHKSITTIAMCLNCDAFIAKLSYSGNIILRSGGLRTV